MAGMKTLAKISATAVALSVACLGARGPWLIAVLAIGAAGMACLFVSCHRLGYFQTPAREQKEAQVIDLTERRREAGPAMVDERHVAEPGACLRAR
jgi:hypothetical protein